MAKEKKHAKLAHAKKGTDADQAVSKLIMLTGKGHRVSNNVTGLADCGLQVVGWRYGTIADLKCWGCMTPDERTEFIVVPPGQFERDKVFAEFGIPVSEVQGGQEEGAA